MSVKSNQMDGDLSVGRNLAVGGRVDIQGGAEIHHNLRVDGWLDAKNIKGANKGVFTDITKLRESYPDGTLPDGSWAIVGGTLPGELWYVDGGRWVDSGKTAGSVTVDVEQYLEEVQTMGKDINSMKGDITEIQKKNDAQDGIINTATNIATTNTANIAGLKKDLDNMQALLVRTHKTVAVGDLDTLRDVEEATVEKPSLYTVTAASGARTLKVGLLIVFSDNMIHTITQTFFTHYLLTDAGGLDENSHDHKLHIYSRNYVLQKQAGEVNTWTAWSAVGGADIGEKIDYIIKDATNEATARQDADDAEAKARADSDKALQGKIDALGEAGYRLMGVATPETDPGTPTENVFWLASTAGRYSHFATGMQSVGEAGSTPVELELADGEVAALLYKGRNPGGMATVAGWTKQTLPMTIKAGIDSLQTKLEEEADSRAKADSALTEQAKELKKTANARDTQGFSSIIYDEVSLEQVGAILNEGTLYTVHYSTKEKCFVVKIGGKYYNSWTGSKQYMDATTPYVNKIYIDESENIPYRWNGTDLVAIAAKANSASIYNPTVETGSYYVLCDTDDPSHSAVHVAKANRKTSLGLMITFALKKGTWKTYQYIGASTEDNAWYVTDNWKDFGSMVQGSEAMIDIDRLVPLPTGYYTLGTALSALKTYQESTGVNYQKRGLVISYATEANKVETKQYQGDSALTADFWEAGLWQDFGGGSKLTVSDAMEEGGQDPFSTGGAYKTVPSEIEAEENEGSVSLRLKNKGGDIISETQFAVGTGSGSAGGTTVAINFKDDPFYVRAGGTATVKAAIRSVTKLADGSSQENKIVSAVFTNRTTKTTVASFKPNQASSGTLQSYTFEFDLTALATAAGSTELQLEVADATGQHALRNMEMIAVDVTVESSQTLNYTKDTSLQVGGQKVSIPMYRFPHNASDKGIQTKIEIYKSGAWETLDDVLVKDTYTHNVTIDPTGLGHGAYPLRIQGTDVASGLQGNVLHTAVMVIEQRESVSDYDKPIVVARWYDDNAGKVKLFQTISFDVACYQRNNANPTVEVSVTDATKKTTESIASKVMNRSSYYAIEKRIVGYSDGDTLTFDAVCGEASLSEKLTAIISGSLLSIAETEGAYYKISMAGRSNADTDKTIKATASDGSAVGINVHGSNYSTNGFVADNFGTEQTDGRMALRVAENVTAECTDKPFASNSIPTNGMALSLTFMVRNIAKRDAQIIKCMSDKLGFVLTGEKFIVSTNGDSADALKNVQSTAATSYLDSKVYRIDIVVEPQARAPYSGIMLCKVYQNGDESACVPIDTSNGFPAFEDTIHFDGTDADIYLYEITRWNSYYDFIQAFNNYIVNLTDTQAMLTEYEQNNVMTDVTAEGTTKPRPDMQKLLDRGIDVIVMTRTSDNNLSKDGSPVTDSEIYYPDHIEPLKDKKTSVLMDIYVYFAVRPWASVKIEACPTTNQGTSTLAYPIKNKKGKIKKAKRIVMLYTREEVAETYKGRDDFEEIMADYDDCAALAKKKKIRVKKGSTSINIATVKVDYSDSPGANNCALMEQMNDLQVFLGGEYLVPGQRYNTNKEEVLHTSIDGSTAALFRTDYKIGQDKGPSAATLPENAYFHAKANLNVDKDNPHFFAFEDVEGYNKGCVNYGDFKEMVTPRGTDIDAYKATVLADTSALVPGTLYMISEFCGPKYRFIENDGTGSMREVGAVSVDSDHTLDKTLAEVQADDVNNYDWGAAYLTSDGKYVQYKGGSWKDTTGSMTYDPATKKWSVTGRVLNPTDCIELRQYQGFCWFQGVNTVDDLLKPTSTGAPLWTTYFESRYPDDDALNELYETGQKVPYQLYRMLAFCQQCNQNLSEDAEANAATNADGSERIFNGAGASTTITLDGVEVAGTKENRLKKWQHEMHKYFAPKDNLSYVVKSDYKATVDQRAKNMMLLFQMEADGTIRAYIIWYDGDSVDEADNDCYLTIPWDMDGESHLYQGWDGVMFRQNYALYNKGEGVWTDDEGKHVVTLHDVAEECRNAKTDTGQEIFSADGCYRYWMTDRILKWPKVVSSFDGERKYIEAAKAGDSRFPALHGLRIDSLPAFQKKRFAFRDGYYQTGDLFRHFFSARMMGAIRVNITAAQDGYFAMGVDSTSRADYSCYLKAGESHTFTTDAAGEGGKLIYIFGADKIGTLDLSGCTPKNSNWMIADCTLLRKLILGGTDYTPAYTIDILSALSLGQMPFLEEIDIRNTKILTLNASGCPRLKSVLAEGSLLQNLTLAESSPVETLHLPATVSDIRLVNLPKLQYGKNGGLRFDDMGNLKTITAIGCPGVDAATMLRDAVAGGARLTAVRMDVAKTTGEAATLKALMDAGTIGLGSDQTTVCDGLTGKWTMAKYCDEKLLGELKDYFPALAVRQQLYSDYVIFDNTKSQKSIYNTDNGTGYVDDDTYTPYKPSGHILNIRARSKGVRGTFNSETQKMHLDLLSDSDYTKLADGVTDSDIKDSLGKRYDFFQFIPHYWYKGINDYKTQKKHILLSTWRDMPEATATRTTEARLSDCLIRDTYGLMDAKVSVGDTFGDGCLGELSACATYRMDVEGMRQARYIGLNNATVCSVFTDAGGKIIQKDVFSAAGIAESPMDFSNEQGDYIYRDVPTGAKWLYFTCMRGLSDDGHPLVATDSTDLEAIEPGWVEHKAGLIGLKPLVTDDLGFARSISGRVTRRGDGRYQSGSWSCDKDGNPTGMPVETLHYTFLDLLNLCLYRGKGYHCISYEQNKDMAILSLCHTGQKDSQAYYGSGSGSGWTTGTRDGMGNSDSRNINAQNLVWGLEGFDTCMSEIMDNVAVNVPTFKAWKKAQRTDANIGDVVKFQWHIMDDYTGEEREVMGTKTSGYCISRIALGRHCDTIATSVYGSNWNTGYCAGFWISNQLGRCVGRSDTNSFAGGGLVYASAYYGSSTSSSDTGARLAFTGEIENESEIDPE